MANSCLYLKTYMYQQMYSDSFLMNVKIKTHAGSKKFYDVNLSFWQLYFRDIMDEKKLNMGY